MEANKIAMMQLLVEGAEPERNIERALPFIQQAKENKCKMVVLPETIDFGWTHPYALEHSMPIPGAYSDVFCQQAALHQIYVCVGLTERVGNVNYNTAILIDDMGAIILKHRKLNLLEVEFPYYEMGNKVEVVATPFGKIGINICSDNYVNGLHIGHCLAQMGAEMIISPCSWTVSHQVTEQDDAYYDKWLLPYSYLSNLYCMMVIGVSSVGYIIGGPYIGKKMVGGSLAIHNNSVQQAGINEFASELLVIDYTYGPKEKLKGVQIGNRLTENGFKFIQP